MNEFEKWFKSQFGYINLNKKEIESLKRKVYYGKAAETILNTFNKQQIRKDAAYKAWLAKEKTK